MSATLDPINRSFWFSRLYLAVSVPGGRNSITSWRQEYNCRLFEVFQSCRFETKTLSRPKIVLLSHSAPASFRPLSQDEEEVVELKSNKHKAGIKSGTGRDGASGFAFGNRVNSPLHGSYENNKEREIQLIGRTIYIIRRRLRRCWACLMAKIWPKCRYIALHGAQRFLKLLDDDEGSGSWSVDVCKI